VIIGSGSNFQALVEEFFLQIRPPVAMFLPTASITAPLMLQGDEIDSGIVGPGRWWWAKRQDRRPWQHSSEDGP